MSHKDQINLTSENIKREYEEHWKCAENEDPLAQWDPIGISFKVLKKEEKDIKKEDLSQNETDKPNLHYGSSDDECENDSSTGVFANCSETSMENKEKEFPEHENLLESKHKNEKKRHKYYSKSTEKFDFQDKDEKYVKKFACGDCGERYFGFRLLQKHINDVHLGTSNYSETFSLKRHASLLDKSKKKYKCQICQGEFSSWYYLKKHRVVHAREKELQDYEAVLPVVPLEDQQKIHKSFLEDTNKKLNFHEKNKIYTCNICHKTYTQQRRLKYHIEAIHLGLSEYKCVQCNKTYSSVNVLSKHIRFVHNANKCKYKCEVCHREFAHPSYLKSHSITHTTRKYACADCGWKFHLHTQLKKHITFNCKANPGNRCIKVKKHSCGTCGKKFTTYGNLQAHIGLVHIGIDYKCAQCNMTFRSINSLKIHNNKVHSFKKYECQVCQKKFTDLCKLRDHSVRHTIKKYECADCGWKLFTYNELKKHITLRCKANIKNMGIKVKKYSCDACEKKYLKFPNLQAHIRLAHLGITDYKCAQCNKTYPFMSSLQRHNKDVHSVKKYECLQCHKRFPLLYRLKKHLDVHNGMKKYVCEDCGMGYLSFWELRNHINKVHNKIKNYQCEQCGKRFFEPNGLVQHIDLVHKKVRKYECQICYKKFQAIHHLQNHIICVHEKVKNFVCDQCGDSFLLAHHLRNHVSAVHKGIKVKSYRKPI